MTCWAAIRLGLLAEFDLALIIYDCWEWVK